MKTIMASNTKLKGLIWDKLEYITKSNIYQKVEARLGSLDRVKQSPNYWNKLIKL